MKIVTGTNFGIVRAEELMISMIVENATDAGNSSYNYSDIFKIELFIILK